MEDVLKGSSKSLTVVANPFFSAKDFRSHIRHYKVGMLEKEINVRSFRRPALLTYVRDFVFSLLYVVLKGEKYDICVALSGFDAIVGIVLRRLHFTKATIFYTIDYVPQRFGNNTLNRIYHWADRYAVKNSDIVWNLSPRMTEARKEKGIGGAPQIVVRHGVDFDGIERLPYELIDRFAIIYSGSLTHNTGVDVAIDAFEIVATRFPKASFIITGGGPDESKIREKVKGSKVSDRIRFVGFINEHKQLIELLTHCGIGMATYRLGTYTQFADVYKVREYMACGLPVIMTRSTLIAEDVENYQAGFVVDGGAEEIAHAIERLLSDELQYKTIRENAMSLASKFDQKEVYGTAMVNLVQYLKDKGKLD